MEEEVSRVEREDERFSWEGDRQKREDERFVWKGGHFLSSNDPGRHREWRDGGSWRTGMLPDHEKFRRPEER